MFFKNSTLDKNMVNKSLYADHALKEMLATIFFSNSSSILFETLGFDIKKIRVKHKLDIFCKKNNYKYYFKGFPFWEISFNGRRPSKWCWQYFFSNLIVAYNMNFKGRVKEHWFKNSKYFLRN